MTNQDYATNSASRHHETSEQMQTNNESMTVMNEVIRQDDFQSLRDDERTEPTMRQEACSNIPQELSQMEIPRASVVEA